MKKKQRVSTALLDGLWRDVIRLLYSGQCAVCRGDGHDCHHVVPRFNKSQRWNPLNGVLLCAEHHLWAHEKPKEFMKWLKKTLPAIHKNSKTNHPLFSDKERESIKSFLLMYKKELTKLAMKCGSGSASVFSFVVGVYFFAVGIFCLYLLFK